MKLLKTNNKEVIKELPKNISVFDCYCALIETNKGKNSIQDIVILRTHYASVLIAVNHK